jgi:tRNA pseudouridine38-40 synthase
MQKICKMFIGEHDFVHLRCLGTPTSTTVRKIYDCSVDEVKLLKDGPVAVDPLYVFTVTGSGFLKQMVRMMVGSCWDVLKGGRDLKQLQNSLNGIAPDQAWSVAPPSGLYLYRVDY